MRPISLVAAASHLPETVVREEFFSSAGAPPKKRVGAMFDPPVERRHVHRDDSSADMIERAARKLIDRLNLDPRNDIDAILTNVSLPDTPFTGCGAEVAQRLGAPSPLVIDLHNTGCVSPIYMVELARMIMQTTPARSALLCNVQTAAGRVFAQPEVREKPQAQIPGDGCGVLYVVANDESPVLSLVQRTQPEAAGDMVALTRDARRYWEPGESAFYVDFSERRVATILRRGNRLVPDVIQEACRRAEVETTDIDLLITNQPSRLFLRNWREALEVPAERHADTFDRYGNLFGAGIPITLDEAIADGRLRPGHLLALGGFAHAGDYAAATLVRWRARG
jgi:3-oxoacyl-[acyl-carrier-protein] synthase-3